MVCCEVVFCVIFSVSGFRFKFVSFPSVRFPLALSSGSVVCLLAVVYTTRLISLKVVWVRVCFYHCVSSSCRTSPQDSPLGLFFILTFYIVLTFKVRPPWNSTNPKPNFPRKVATNLSRPKNLLRPGKKTLFFISTINNNFPLHKLTSNKSLQYLNSPPPHYYTLFFFELAEKKIPIFFLGQDFRDAFVYKRKWEGGFVSMHRQLFWWFPKFFFVYWAYE